jgi:hypothetical protein
MANRYWVGGTGSWDNTARWSTTSGGTTGASVPASSDDVFFDANSGSGTVTVPDWFYEAGNLDFTGFTGTFAGAEFSFLSVYKNLTLGSAMTLTYPGAISMEGSGTFNVTSNGKTASFILLIFGATVVLADNFVSNNEIQLSEGTFNANNKNVTCSNFSFGGTPTRSLIMGSGTWTLTGNTDPWYTNTTTGLTFDAGTSTIKLTGALTADRAFNGAGRTYHNFWNATTGGYAIIITGSNTFNDFKITAGSRQKLTGGTTQTVTSFDATGDEETFPLLTSTNTTNATLVKAGGGVVSVDYINVSYITGSPANTWYMGNNSIDSGNNVNVYFTEPSSAPDKTALTAAINAEYSDGANRTTLALTEADYTSGSWTAYTNAIAAAITVEADAGATQTQIDDAAALIGTTKSALVFAGLADLNAAKDAANALTEADYTAGSWSDLTTALALPETTNAEVVTKTGAINAAIAALVFAGQAALDAAKALAAGKVEAEYTALSWAAFQDDLATALALPETTNAEMVAKTTAINDAIALLVLLGDLTALNALIAEAQALHDSAEEGTQPGNYAVGSKATLQAAIDAVVVTEEDGQLAIDAAFATLNAALNAFKAGLVLPELQIIIEGIDRTADVDIRSLSFARETRNAEMTFRMRGIDNFPLDGGVVELWYRGSLLFAGRLQASDKDSPVPEKTGVFQVIDWYDVLMEQLVRRTYSDTYLYDVIHDILKTKVHKEQMKVMLRLEESADDLSNFGNSGTTDGTFTETGFDGEITIPSTGALDERTALTVCLDVTLDAFDTTLLSKGTAYSVSVNSNGTVRFSVHDGAAHSITTPDTLTLGRHTIICAFDRPTGRGRIFIDGVLSKTGVLTTDALTVSANDLILDGLLHRFSFYAKSFSPMEARRWHLDILEVKAPRANIEDLAVDRISFPYRYPAECLTELGESLGLNWTIDANMALRMLDTPTGEVSFAEDDTTVIQESVIVQTDHSEIRNAVFVRGGNYLGDWRYDTILADGGSTVYPLPYRYSGFNLFTDTPSLASSLRSWWKMNDTSGSLVDTQGVNTLDSVSNLTYEQEGQIGNAISFGATSVARKASGTFETGDNPHSVTLWAKMNAQNNTLFFMGEFMVGQLWLMAPSATSLLIATEGGGLTVETGDLTGEWHHIGFSYGNETRPTLRLFLDGEQIGEEVIPALDLAAGPISIGTEIAAVDGLIDDVHLFDYALSEQEVNSIYRLGKEEMEKALLRTGVEFLSQDDEDVDGFYSYQERSYRFKAAPTGTLFPTGRPEAPILTARTDRGSIALYGRRELEINDSSMESLYLASRRAAAELAKRRAPLQTITFATHTPVEPGMIANLSFPSFEAEGQFKVQRVTTRSWLPATENEKMFQYSVECVSATSRDWIDFLRELARKQKKIDPSEGDAIQDIAGHDEEIAIEDVHTIKTPTDHAEGATLADAHTTQSVASGQWKWQADGGGTTDGARWNLADWR